MDWAESCLDWLWPEPQVKIFKNQRFLPSLECHPWFASNPLVITPVHPVLEQPSANDLISLKTSSLNHWVASWALTLQWTKAVPRT
jgi:hypothetical protein